MYYILYDTILFSRDIYRKRGLNSSNARICQKILSTQPQPETLCLGKGAARRLMAGKRRPGFHGLREASVALIWGGMGFSFRVRDLRQRGFRFSGLSGVGLEGERTLELCRSV